MASFLGQSAGLGRAASLVSKDLRSLSISVGCVVMDFVATVPCTLMSTSLAAKKLLFCSSGELNAITVRSP